jgi:phosphoglycolate/pyridoxal phosphate phosphatase family enzyme
LRRQNFLRKKNKFKDIFLKHKLFIFDLDGVIYLGKKLIPNAKETISYLRKKGKKIYFLTNNSSRTRKEYKNILEVLGIHSDEEDFITSSVCMRFYLQSVLKNKEKILLLGARGLKEEIKKLKANVFLLNGKVYEDYNKEKKFDYLVVGVDRKFNFKKLRDCQWAILQGAKSTNKDLTFPTEKGILPGAGCFIKAIESSTNRRAKVIGKPNPYPINLILKKEKKFKRKETIIIGDRWETDIICGKKAKIKTLLVLTGITKKEDLKKIPKKFYPDYVIPDICINAK